MDGEGGTVERGGSGGAPGGTLCLRCVLYLLCPRRAPRLTFPHTHHVLINIHMKESVGGGRIYVSLALLRLLLRCVGYKCVSVLKFCLA